MGLNTPSGGGGAPADAAYVTGSSNSELSNETVVSPAGDILTSGSFGNTVSLSAGFDTYTQVDANNPSLLLVTITATTDGNTEARIQVNIDESGGSAVDYIALRAFVSDSAANFESHSASSCVPLPPGATFEIENASDPNGSNKILLSRAVIITP